MLIGATNRGPFGCDTRPSVDANVVADAEWVSQTTGGAAEAS